jgi:hypothetical protein
MLATATVFEVTSRLGTKIRLSDMQWSHIEARHRELRGQLDKMKLTLIEPDTVYYSAGEETYHYYKKFSRTPVSEKFLLLVAKHRDGEGFIITAFFVARIRRQEKVLVYGGKNRNFI